MIASTAAACVFAAVWMLSLPSWAAFRLTAVLRPTSAGAVRPVPGIAVAWLRRICLAGGTVIVSAVACVFVAVRVFSIPSRAAFRLTSVLGPRSAGAVVPPGPVITGPRRICFAGCSW
jgi:NhaP-type Na+/H+ or K+/H+ antiporter